MTFEKLCDIISSYYEIDFECPINTMDLDKSKCKHYNDRFCSIESCKAVIRQEIFNAVKEIKIK